MVSPTRRTDGAHRFNSGLGSELKNRIYRKDVTLPLKVFFDDDSLLPVSRGRSLVIGFELTGKKPEVREGWRDMLARIFRQGYIDPRVASQTKYYLQPNTMGHFYDLAVLDADFVFEAKDTDLLNRLNYIIKQAIEDEAEDVKVDWE